MISDKPLSDTSIYKYTELMSGNGKLDTLIKNALNEKLGAEFVEPDKIEDVIYRIRHKSFNFQAKFAVLELYRKGIIKLLFNEKSRLTVAVPFFKYKMETGGYGVIVNISGYAKKNQDGTYHIDYTTLYCLMLSAAFLLTSNKQIQFKRCK